MKLDIIDIQYACSNKFNFNSLPKSTDGKIKYGYKSIGIANYIIGIAKSNLKNEKHKFFDKKFKCFQILENNESVIKYNTIMKKFKCSRELIKFIVNKLIKFKLFNHNRFSFINPHSKKIQFTNIWIFTFLDKSIYSFYKNFRRIGIRTNSNMVNFISTTKAKRKVLIDLYEKNLVHQQKEKEQKCKDIKLKMRAFGIEYEKLYSYEEKIQALVWIENKELRQKYPDPENRIKWDDFSSSNERKKYLDWISLKEKLNKGN